MKSLITELNIFKVTSTPSEGEVIYKNAKTVVHLQSLPYNLSCFNNKPIFSICTSYLSFPHLKSKFKIYTRL